MHANIRVKTLTDRVVVVTGAAGRLGRRVVRDFVEHGAAIAALDIDETSVRDIPFPDDAEGWAYPTDVTDVEQVRASFREIEDRFGQIDALVHTTGGWDAQPLLDTSLKDWEHLVRLNLTSTFLCFREAARLMQARGGRLIAIASGQGADRGVAEQGAYSASKAGVIRLVESVADEFNGTGITAHAIAPSMILFDNNAENDGVPAGRIVSLCRYLCTEEGDALNGATLRTYGTALG